MNTAPSNAVVWSLVLALGVGCHRGGPTPPAAPSVPQSVNVAANGRAEIRVGGEGYVPAIVNAPPNSPITLVFTRTTDETCGQHVRFPSLNIDRALPLNQPVEVPVTTPATGTLAFTCGMGMFQGSVVAH